ncbi:hypothetical protein MPSEU_000701800 [Mayamaea pseudoterrestris]|nr:hypothetical protein MPSEU_000701800 [Mayamaea pseudoterrestris]
MKIAILSCLLASALAFAPAAQQRTSTALNYDINSAFGVTVETGNKCPPLGAMLLEDTDERALKWFQNAEIKNGRVAMLATIGYWVQKMGMHFPLYLGPSGSNSFHPESADTWYLSTSAGITFADVAKAATPFDALGMIPAAGWLQLLAAAGAFELTAWNRQWNEERAVPGDYGYDPLGFTKRAGGLESAELKQLRIQEIKNGRLAMIAIAGWLSEESIPGSFPVPFHP